MTEPDPTTEPTRPAGEGQRYAVVLLVEHAFTEVDAHNVLSLHEAIEDPVHYHVLLPVHDGDGRLEASMGTLAGGEALASPGILLPAEDIEALRQEILSECRTSVLATVSAIEAAGGSASGEAVSVDPVEALASKVREVGAAEAIIVTRPHVVQEFFHLDWTHRARRQLGVPVLHLLEHETFDEQAGEGEGVTGF